MLAKQPINVSFAKGLDQKTDPYQIPIGNFLRLQNSVFTTGMRLTKRNGYGELTSLPTPATFLTTFNTNLTAIGNSLQAYSSSNKSWITKGNYTPLSLTTLPLIRSNTNQTQVDAVTSLNGLVCTVFTDTTPSGVFYKYAVADAMTGQNILPPALIPSLGTVTNAPRVFNLGHYFIILFGSVITATNHLRYVLINTVNPVAPTTDVQISSSFSPSTTLAFDAYMINNSLFIAWNGADVGGAIRVSYLTTALNLHTPIVFSTRKGTIVSVTADATINTPDIWISFWDSASTNGYTLAVNTSLVTVLAPTQIITTTVISNLTSVAENQVMTAYYEIPSNYSYDSSIPSHHINTITCTESGTVGAPSTLIRSVGLASKAFLVDSIPYFLSIYFSAYQPTYFLVNGSGQIVSKLAYSNGGTYLTHGLPNYTISETGISIAYQFKDLIEAVNKDQGVVNTAGVYSQTGLNYVTFTIGTESIVTEIAQNLQLTGGFLWAYDGYSLVEDGFQVWPDNVEVTTTTPGGGLTNQQYFYQVIYEWTDNQGMIHRSAPSVPVGQVTAGSGNSSTNTIHIPTLRLTYKISNPVKIVVYRWSTAQQNYYQVTSVSTPTLNDPTVDSIDFVDALSDSAILGNSLIYTTGGVIENIAAPAFNSITLFDDRLWGIDGEDTNLLWYSKQVIEATPMETSDLFTVYVAPSTSSQGSTGPTRCIAPLDDKLIIFKDSAMYYINGSGPDNTGSNSQYSQPTFITSTVGCRNQQSIVFMQDGLMFQSEKGIWLLNRSLGTQYIGAPVEQFTNVGLVQSAVNIPDTTQVRFTLDTGVTLMYDYFYQQWGTFVGVAAISSTLYQGLHTFLNKDGLIFQETPGVYLDGSVPVLQAFSTGWIAAAGLQGFQRIYFMYLLGTYLSPHKLSIQIAYDYDSNPIQSTLVLPDNFSANWGVDTPWGGSGSWGGSTNVENERVFFNRQKCNSFQIIIDEVYDASFGMAAGAGLTLSGLNLVIGVKKGYPTLPSTRSFG